MFPVLSLFLFLFQIPVPFVFLIQILHFIFVLLVLFLILVFVFLFVLVLVLFLPVVLLLHFERVALIGGNAETVWCDSVCSFSVLSKLFGCLTALSVSTSAAASASPSPISLTALAYPFMARNPCDLCLLKHCLSRSRGAPTKTAP